jgi:hypothetical protein
MTGSIEDHLRSALDDVTAHVTLRHPKHPGFDVDDGSDLTLVSVSPTQSHHRPSRGVRPSVLVALAAFAACAVALALVALPATITKASAATVLGEAERNVSGGLSPAPGQYLYESTTSSETISATILGHRFSAELPYTGQVWIGTGRSGRRVVVPGKAAFPSLADHSAWVAAGSPSIANLAGVPAVDLPLSKLLTLNFTGTAPNSFPSDTPANVVNHIFSVQERAGKDAMVILFGQQFGVIAFPPAVVEALPSQPAALNTYLVDHYEGGVSSVETTFSMAASLLEEGTTRSQRVAIFKLMSTLPGIRLDGSAITDVRHQQGMELSFAQQGTTTKVIIAPSTGQILEEKLVFSGADPHTMGSTELNQYTVYEAARIVNSSASTS